MKIIKYIALIILVTHCYLSSYASDSFSGVAYKIPFVNSSGLILIEGQHRGEQGYFIFDTGADAVVLNDKGHKSNKTVEFSTLTGTLATKETKVSKLSLGTYTFHDIEAYVSDLSELALVIDGNLLGILGSNIFSLEVLHIDKVNKVIELYDNKQSLTKTTAKNIVKISMEIKGNLLLVPLTIGGKEYKFALDTGSSVSMIDSRIIEEQNDALTKLNTEFRLITAHDKSVTSDIYELEEAHLSNLRIKQLQFGSTDLSAVEGQIPADCSGILSIDQLPLDELVIDFKNQVVYFLL